MSTLKGYWCDVTNGKIYVIESTAFGEVVGGAGPIDANDLRALDDYEYKPAIVDWLKKAIAGHKLRRINPPHAGKSEIRISKCETILNDQNSKYEMKRNIGGVKTPPYQLKNKEQM